MKKSKCHLISLLYFTVIKIFYLANTMERYSLINNFINKIDHN